MSLPILLNHKSRAWRSNPLIIPIQCWLDRKKTQPLPLSDFGPTWRSQVRTTYTGPLIAEFDVDVTDLATGRVELSLPGATTATLTEPVYVYDVEVTGGTLSPLTIFLGSFIVEGDVTRA